MAYLNDGKDEKGYYKEYMRADGTLLRVYW